MNVVNKIINIVGKSIAKKFLFVLAGIIFLSLLETLALAVISPVLAVLLEPEIAMYDPIVSNILVFFGIYDIHNLLIFLVFLVACIYIFRGIYAYFFNMARFRFTAKAQSKTSNKLIKKLLGYSYVYHSNKNIAQSQNIVIPDVEQLFMAINAFLNLITELFTSFFIFIFLLIISPIITLMLVGVAGLCIGLYLFSFKGILRKAGRDRRKSLEGMIKSVNQALGGIKEVKVLNRESFFSVSFEKSSTLFAVTAAKYNTLNFMPRIIIETVCFSAAFIVLGIFILQGTDISKMIPELSLFVVAAFRVLPSLSRVTTYLTTVMNNAPSINAVYQNLFTDKDQGVLTLPEPTNIVSQNSDIIISNLSFSYPNTEKTILENISITIPDKKSVAFIGASGAGKTTLVDIILGILAPTQGSVQYKGFSVHHNFDQWSKYIGYIPQQIYLLDETIRENVAFGVAKDEIDDEKVWQALQQAKLADFVKDMPNGLNTFIGDRGVRLSGGQRQRLGISRAMYQDPPILILDEATSALDTETETAVMQALIGLQGSKTMIIIAHRLTTIEHCDIIYRVENKNVTEGAI